jgi:predicted lactoylglutathione lyase
MLFTEAVFKSFSRNENTDTQKGTEVLLSFDAESREEVDEITNKAEQAGGTVYGKPSEIQGFMYGSGFTDLDGHRWNALFMHMGKMKKG